MTIPVTPYRCKVWRIISSRYPPVSIFEQIAGPEDFEALYQLEARTNDRLRNESGNLKLIAPQDCAYGAGAGYIMAAFTHLSPEGSRFSDGSYGVYYAAKDLRTAVEETKYHRIQFLKRTNEQPQELDMRVLTAQLNAPLHDIAGKRATLPQLYQLNDYRPSQVWARPLHAEGSNGIGYDSVRMNGGSCVAVFKPRVLSRCSQAQHLRYAWNGETIADVLELRQVA